jgi:hypothetical protein
MSVKVGLENGREFYFEYEDNTIIDDLLAIKTKKGITFETWRVIFAERYLKCEFISELWSFNSVTITTEREFEWPRAAVARQLIGRR